MGKSGVPEGTVLGPSLFEIFTDDCEADLKFVDDMVLIGKGDIRNQHLTIQRRLNKIERWADEWGVNFNPDKTVLVYFGKPRERQDLHFKGKKVVCKEEYEYLGVLFHGRGNFKSHIERKILPRIGKLMGMFGTH